MSLAARDGGSSSGSVPAGDRWCQLTYTAFDASRGAAGEGSGGWQVKESSEDLSDRERRDLLRSIATEISLVQSLSRFPSRSEVEALPRRLRFRRGASGGIWCHSVHAGPDATGRPNNVFNHALLDRWAGSGTPGPSNRPIEAWHAPEWLTPFGAAEVQQVRLGPEPPVRGPVLTRRAVVEFLLDDSTYRFDVFGLLLDAVAQAVAGGPPVVLLAPSADEGALWLGAVSFFTAPTVCLEISFCTYERLETVLADVSAGQALVVSITPEQDEMLLSGVTSPPVVVIDPRAQPRTRTVGDVAQREAPFGQLVQVTDWSRLALNVCCEASVEVEQCLERLDQVSAGVSWPASGPPGWPLAAAVTISPGFPLARELAIRMLLRDTPAGMPFTGELRQALHEHLTSAVHSAEEAWDRLSSTAAGSGHLDEIATVALDTYAHHALMDEHWMLGQQPPPLPARKRSAGSTGNLRQAPASLKIPVAQALDRLAPPRSAGSALERGVLLLRTLDFVIRLQSLVGPIGVPAWRLRDLSADAADLLRGRLGPEIARRTGPLAPVTVRELIGPALLPVGDRDWPDEQPGRRLVPALLDLVRPGYRIDRLLQKSQGELEEDPVGVELLVADALRSGPDLNRTRAAVVALLIRDAATKRDVVEAHEVAEIVGRLEGGRPWAAAELIDLLTRGGHLANVFLVPEILNRLPEWADDPDGWRLAAALRIAIIEITPGWDDHGRPLARRDGVTETDRNLLHILEITGPGWYLAGSGLCGEAASILSLADKSWAALAPYLQGVIGGRVVVAAFQTAIALAVDGYADIGWELRQHAHRGAAGEAWRPALDHLVQAVPILEDLLAQDDDKLTRQLIRAQTRIKLGSLSHRLRDPRQLSLTDLPVDYVLRRLLQNRPPDQASALVQAGVDAELAEHDASEEQLAVVLAYWTRLLARDGDAVGAPSAGSGSVRGRLRLSLRRRSKGDQK